MLHFLAFALLAVVPAPAEGEAPEVEDSRQQEEEEEVCRIRRIPSERVGERFRRQRICMSREEWEERERRR